MPNIDLGGNTLIVEGVNVGATAPGQTGTALAGAELAVLDGAAAANTGTSKAVLTGTAGSLTVGGNLIGSVQAVTAAGAVDLVTLITTIASAGAIALTLADGAAGQIKIIKMITDGGDATLTPTNFREGSTITFNDANDSVILMFVGTEWHVLVNNGTTIA